MSVSKQHRDYKDKLAKCVDAVCRISAELGISPLELSRDTWIDKRKKTDPTMHAVRMVGGWNTVREAAAKKLGVAPIEPTAVITTLVDNHRRDLQADQLKKVNAELVRKLKNMEDTLEVMTQLREQTIKPLPVVKREKTSRIREATAVLLCSDWHVEERVFPEQINGRNEYNPEIATSRTRNLVEGLRWLLDLYKGKIAVRDLIVWLGGDMITGFIHEELQETNAMSPIQASMFCQDLLATELFEPLLADKSLGLERLIVPCNYGNHGRVKKQKQHKNAAQNSYEWAIYHGLRQRFNKDPRIEFHIANGAHLYMNVYDLSLRFHHGDDMNYGGGVGGLSIPVNKALDSWNTYEHADLTCFGHFHQYMSLSNFVSNGSLIGYNEYALSIKAKYEPPQQAFFLIDSERGKRHSTPIWVDDESFESSLRTSHADK